MANRMKQTPNEAPEKGTDVLRADLRIPFAICAVEALLLLILYTLLVHLQIQPAILSTVGVVLISFYVLTAGGTFLVYALQLSRIYKAQAEADQLNSDVYRLFRTVVDIPYAVVNSDGTVLVVNSALKDILGFRSPVCRMPLEELCPGVSFDKILASAKDGSKWQKDKIADHLFPERESLLEAPIARLGDKKSGRSRRYEVDTYRFNRRGEHYFFLIFRDVNDYLSFMEKTNREHVVLAYIVMDNLQELTQFVRANYRATANEIEATLSRWVEGMNGMLREYDRDKYLAIFSEEMLDKCIKDGFPILDEIMSIRVGDNSFPVSISMGIADIDGSMQERDKSASSALDLALQRGGNQVALIRRNAPGVAYFGGAHKTLESNTSITSRVSASLIEKRLQDCDTVLIMGHVNPDFDAIGATVGAYRLCRSILAHQKRERVPVYIVANLASEALATCRAHLATVPEYDHVFIDSAKAQETVTPNTVLIITDVSNPAIFEAPDLVQCIPSKDGVASVAVIDHHRLVSALPFVPFLHYIEATKSSACEIMGEILEQSAYADTLLKEEANLLLAGIMLDTHNFTRSAGAQTFEVAYYLYGRNAHTGTAKEFFNQKFEELKVAGDFDAHTHIYADIFAVTWPSEDHAPSPEDRIAASKAADKLLDLQGIEASFALAVIDGNVIISGRSKGKINVQLILEKLDGGGHFDMAGAQVKHATVNEVFEMLKGAIDEYMAERSVK